MTRIAISIVEAAELSGIGRSSIYSAIKRGELRLKKSGRRSLILVDDLKTFIATLPDAKQQASISKEAQK